MRERRDLYAARPGANASDAASVKDGWRVLSCSDLAQEVRFAARTLIRSRFVTSLAILAFALGIGVTSAVFSIFNGVLLKPLPFPDAQELVSVYDTQPACATCPASFPKYVDWKTRNTVFAAIGGSTQASFTLTGAGDAIRVQGAATTASLGDVFGVPPMLGRWYTEQEDQFGGPTGRRALSRDVDAAVQQRSVSRGTPR